MHEIILPRFLRYFSHSFPYLHCWTIFYFPFFTSPTTAGDPKEVKIQNTQNASKTGSRMPGRWRHSGLEMLEVDARWSPSKNRLKSFNKIEQKEVSSTQEKCTHLWEMLVGKQSKGRPTSAPYSNSHLLCKFKEIVSLLPSEHLPHWSLLHRDSASPLPAAGDGLQPLLRTNHGIDSVLALQQASGRGCSQKDGGYPCEHRQLKNSMTWTQVQELSLGFCILLWELFSDFSEAKIVNC